MKYNKEEIKEYIKIVEERHKAQIIDKRNHGQSEFIALERLLKEDIPMMINIIKDLIEPPKCTCSKCTGVSDIEDFYKEST